MSAFDQAAHAAEQNTRQAQDAAQESWSQMQPGFADAGDNFREFHLRIIDMLRSHAEASFDLAEKLITAKSPEQLVSAWKGFAEKQANTISKHSGELAGMAQHAVKDSVQGTRRGG